MDKIRSKTMSYKFIDFDSYTLKVDVTRVFVVDFVGLGVEWVCSRVKDRLALGNQGAMYVH